MQLTTVGPSATIDGALHSACYKMARLMCVARNINSSLQSLPEQNAVVQAGSHKCFFMPLVPALEDAEKRLMCSSGTVAINGTIGAVEYTGEGATALYLNGASGTVDLKLRGAANANIDASGAKSALSYLYTCLASLLEHDQRLKDDVPCSPLILKELAVPAESEVSSQA